MGDTNLIPIYESLSYYNSNDNPNQGSKRVALRVALTTALASYGLNFPHNEHNPRAIGNVAGVPTASSSCIATGDDGRIQISNAHSKHIKMLVALLVTAIFG